MENNIKTTSEAEVALITETEKEFIQSRQQSQWVGPGPASTSGHGGMFENESKKKKGQTCITRLWTPLFN